MLTPEGQGSAILSLIGGLLLFVLVLFLAWFCTRWIAKRYGQASAGAKIKVLDKAVLGPDRSVMIVRVEDRVWLLGVTSQHIEKIDELSPELFPEAEAAEGAAGSPDFSATLQSVLKGWPAGKKREKDNQDG